MVRITQILCPIDFSDFSRHAFDRALAIAKGTGASVTALHVGPSQTFPIYPFLDARNVDTLMLSTVDRDTLTDELKRFLVAEATLDVPVNYNVLEAANVHDEILAQAARLHADLIVMGTHGRTGFRRLFLGSITEKVLRTSPTPVLTVGAVTDTLPIGDAPFRRILCATDFSDCSIAAWHYATSLAERTDASVALVHVVAAMTVGYDPVMGPGIDLSRYEAETEKLGRERLHKLVTESALRVSNVEEIVATGTPYREILRIAAESHSDLIVLGIHGRNPIDRALFGTTAEPVVRRATCPVLTVRPAPQPASAAA